VIARRPEYLPYIKNAVTEDTVAAYFSHLIDETPGIRPVQRYGKIVVISIEIMYVHCSGRESLVTLNLTVNYGKMIFPLVRLQNHSSGH